MARLPPRAKFLSWLVRTAYLPDELPPIVTAKYFARYCESAYHTLGGNGLSLKPQSTSYATFSAPRTSRSRRLLALVHPLGQLRLSLEITNHRTQIAKAIGRSRMSVYRLGSNQSKERAFEGLDFQAWNDRSKKLLAESAYILKADISRFFYTTYTHSIPWAVLGKEQVKIWLEKKSTRKKIFDHWSGKLDTALQGCQSRETFGIPVGPDTSRLIAEVLLSGVETDSRLSTRTQGRPALRLLDDFLVGFDTQREAEEALSILRHILWQYNLQLNDEKTTATESRTQHEDPWKLEIARSNILSLDSRSQRREVQRALEQALFLSQRTESDAPANLICHQLKRIPKGSPNFELVLDSMLRLGRDFPYCVPTVAAYLINNQSALRAETTLGGLAAWLKSMLRQHLTRGHHLEASWCLLVAAALRIHLNEEDLAPIDELLTPVIFCLLALMQKQGLLEKPLQSLGWRSHFRARGPASEYWLPLYEATLRGWTTDRRIIGEVRAIPLFDDMLNKGVTFLEDRVLSSSRIDLKRRVFRQAHSSRNTQNDDNGEVIPATDISSYD